VIARRQRRVAHAHGVFADEPPVVRVGLCFYEIVQAFDLRNVSKPLFLYRKGGSQTLSNRHFEDDSKPVANMLAKLEKNRAFLGEFYFGVRVAGAYLRFLSARSGKGKRILLTIHKAGVLATLYYLSQRIAHWGCRIFSTCRTLDSD